MTHGYWQRRSSRRRFVSGSAVALAGMGGLLAGCGGSNNNNKANNTAAANSASKSATTAAAASATAGGGAAAGTPAVAATAHGTPPPNAKRGGTFRISTLDPNRGFDPGINTLVPVLHSPKVYSKTHLYQVSTDKIFLDMATSIEQADPTTLIIKIRPDIKFHNVAPMNGRLLTSHDMAYTYQRFPDLVKSKSSSLSPLAYSWMDLPNLQMPDSTTLVIKQTQPFADALRLMGQPFFGVVAREAVEANGGDLSKVPTAGSGAYIPTTVNISSDIKYTRNPDYFSHDHADPFWFPPGGPYIDAFDQRVIADPAATQAAIISGDLDTIYFDSLNVDKTLVQELASHANVKNTQSRANDHVGLVLAMQHFNDVRLRKAMMQAIDYQGFINTVYLGEGVLGAPLGNGFPDSLRLPNSELAKYMTYDPKAAKQQWDAAGGSSIAGKVVLLGIANYPFMEQATQFVQQSLQKALGISVDIQSSDIPGWIGRVTGQHDWDQYVVFDQSDPDVPTTNALSGWSPVGTTGKSTGFNTSSPFPAIAQLAQQAITLDTAQAQEIDPHARTAKLYALQRFYLDNVIPMIPLPGRQFWNVVTLKRVNNIPTQDSTLWNNNMVENIWLDPPTP